MDDIVLDIDSADLARLGVFHKLGIAHGVLYRRAGIELFKHSKQHQTNHHPNRDFRKRIIQGRSPACRSDAPRTFGPKDALQRGKITFYLLKKPIRSNPLLRDGTEISKL
jgi:hypothetical protein